MNRVEKEALGLVYQKRISAASALVLVNYRGLAVADLTSIRKSLREVQAEFNVLKNRLAIKALESGSDNLRVLKEYFKNPVAVVFLNQEDPILTVKKLIEFEKNYKNFELVAGIVEKDLVLSKQLSQLSKLPGKDVLLVKIICSLIAPHKGIMGVAKAVPRQLIQVISALKDQTN